MHLSQLVTTSSSTEYSRSPASVSAITSATPTDTSPMTYAGTRTSSISSAKRSRPDDNSPGYSFAPRFPQAPLSPPEEESASKCSLPSISSLLEGADRADSIDQENAAKRQRPNPASEKDWDRRSLSVGSTQFNREKLVLPPTPPPRPGSGFQNHQRASFSSTTSPHAPISASSEPSTDRCRIPSISSSHHSSRSSVSQVSRASVSEGGYVPQPAATTGQPAIPSASPVEPPAHPANYYQHRPSQQGHFAPQLSIPARPTQQPPQPQPQPSPPQPQPQQQHHHHHHHHHQMATAAPVAPGPSPGPSPAAWQHHHYFPPSNAAPYPLNHDRYICRTCHKAFSRPSSLRIHSHSHTGEKPFRCPHVGCGKAFSVRSNMKRHERGCHSARPVAPTLVG